MDFEIESKKEAARVLEALRRLIRVSGLSQRKVEQKVGFSKGYLSQLFAQNLDLKYWHVVAVLRALDEPPQRFFAELYSRPSRHSALDEFYRQAEPPSEEFQEELERLYGTEAFERLRDRVKRCEQALGELERRGMIENF